MDATVVQEIADQLGIAVDQAGQFITEYLPMYAGMKATYGWVGIGFSIFLFILCLIGVIVSLKISFDEDKYWQTRDIAQFTAIIFGVLGIVAFIFICCLVPEAIGWTFYPEGKLIDTVLNSIG